MRVFQAEGTELRRSRGKIAPGVCVLGVVLRMKAYTCRRATEVAAKIQPQEMSYLEGRSKNKGLCLENERV